MKPKDRQSFATQRQDRISEILDLLVLRGWVTLQKQESGNAVYKITPVGKLEYDKWVREFLSFVRILRLGKQRES